MNAPNKTRLNGLALRLVSDGVLSEEPACEAALEAKETGVSFVSCVIAKGLVSGDVIARAASEEFGSPLFDLAAMNKEMLPKGLVDTKLVIKHHTIPLFKRGNRLFIAVSDPTNLKAIDEIQFHTGLSVEAVLAEEDALTAAILLRLKKRPTAAATIISMTPAWKSLTLAAALVTNRLTTAKRSMKRRLYVSLTRYWSTPSKPALPIFISSRMKKAIACVFVPTAFCKALRRHHKIWPVAWRHG